MKKLIAAVAALALFAVIYNLIFMPLMVPFLKLFIKLFTKLIKGNIYIKSFYIVY